MDYDFAKTKTLLYFYEYLIRKGEPKKIDHLACLLGENDFTEDMRDIVGGSLTGLKKLLSKHPYLFRIIDDEFVYLNVNESTPSVIVERDCNEETKEYFKHKLLSYGLGAEVPIKSLHGHRSQAPLQIRHTSGLKSKDFTQFLSKYPETFRIVGKNVLLLGFDDLRVVPSSSHSNLPSDGHKEARNVKYVEQASPQRDSLCDRRQLLGNCIEEAAVNNFNLSLNASYDEPKSAAVFGSVSEGEFENLCEHNCPKISEVANVFSPVQLCVGGIGSKVEIRRNTQIISTVADALQVTGKILQLVVDTGAPVVISFNCKGSSVGTYTQMTLLEVGTPNGYAFLFDVLTCPQIMIDGGVKAILESDRIIKVIHNCRYKSGNLYDQFKIILKCVFDIQLANAVLQYQRNGTKVNKVKPLSFHQLIQQHCPFNSVNEPFARHAWSGRERPFTDEMVVYAAREILALVQIYGCMALSIEDENKPLLSVLCTEEILACIHPQEMKAQHAKRNVNFYAAALNRKHLSRSSVASEENFNSCDSVTKQESTSRRCCDCYADKQIQTLSTGSIVMLSKTYEN